MKTRKRSAARKCKVNPAVFLEAARLIGEGIQGFACHAIALAIARSGHVPRGKSFDEYEETRYFANVLRPKTDYSAWYLTPVGKHLNENYRSIQTARILGLCLCAELAKEGFEP